MPKFCWLIWKSVNEIWRKVGSFSSPLKCATWKSNLQWTLFLKSCLKICEMESGERFIGIFLSNWSLYNNSLQGHQKEPNLPILLRIWIAIQFTVWNCMKCHFLNCISIINGQNFGQYSLQILNCILTV